MSEKVPDATTLVKLTKKYGDIVEELNRLLLEKAKEEKVIPILSGAFSLLDSCDEHKLLIKSRHVKMVIVFIFWVLWNEENG